MRPKSMILLALAIGCGLIASVGISQVIDKKNKGSQVPTEEIVVVKQNVDALQLVDPAVAVLEKWPVDKIPSGAIRKIEDLEQRRVKTTIYAGEPITEARLYKPNENPVASNKIPAGYRVQAVKMDQSSTGGNLIVPGDRVDVLVFIKQNERGQTRVESRTILQDIKVFAVDSVFNPETITGDGKEGSNTIAGKTVSLLVTPDQAEKLALAEEMGKIELTIRGPEDDEVVATQGADDGSLMRPGERGNRKSEKKTNEVASTAGGLLSWITQKSQETPAGAAPPTGAIKPDWTMEVIKGPDRVYAYFKDGKVLRDSEMEAPKPAPSAAMPAQQAPTASQSDAPIPVGVPTEGGEAVPDLESLFGIGGDK